MLDSRVNISYDRKLLQAEEAYLAAALSSMQSKLNELQPVSVLPPEILEEIFRICVSWLYGYLKPKHPLAWTQVCYSWRQISLNSSRLWQRIDLCDHRFADEFLVRSKQAPLSIVSASPLKLTTDNLMLHASRLRCIDVFLLADDMAHLFSGIGSNLPTLTRLSLKVPPQESALNIDLAIPHVCHLVLDCVTVKWQSCRNLVHISLRGLASEFCPSISELHHIFVNSPCLEYIRLENVAPQNLQTEPDHSIPLIYLKDMIISAQPSTVTAILSGLYLGPCARLQLYVSLHQDLHTLFPSGLPYLSDCARSHIGAIRLSRHSTHFLRHGTDTWSEVSAKTLFSISSAAPLITRVCTSLNHLLNLSCVTKFEFNTGVLLDIPLKVLDNLFANLYNLEALCVAFNDLENLLGILQTIQPSTSQLYLPCLRKLSFNKPSGIWHYLRERWLSRILDCLRTRQFHSSSIHTLEFFGCSGISSISTAQLRPFVTEIVIHPERRPQYRF